MTSAVYFHGKFQFSHDYPASSLAHTLLLNRWTVITVGCFVRHWNKNGGQMLANFSYSISSQQPIAPASSASKLLVRRQQPEILLLHCCSAVSYKSVLTITKCNIICSVQCWDCCLAVQNAVLQSELCDASRQKSLGLSQSDSPCIPFVWRQLMVAVTCCSDIKNTC